MVIEAIVFCIIYTTDIDDKISLLDSFWISSTNDFRNSLAPSWKIGTLEHKQNSSDSKYVVGMKISIMGDYSDFIHTQMRRVSIFRIKIWKSEIRSEATSAVKNPSTSKPLTIEAVSRMSKALMTKV